MTDKNHSFADPGPAGLMVLAFYLAALFAVLNNPANEALAGVLVGLGFAGGVVQLLAGLMELRNGAILPGNVMLAFCTFMFLGMFETLFKILKWLPPNTAGLDGFIFLTMGVLMVGVTAGFLCKNLAAGLFMIFADIFFLSGAFGFLFHIAFLLTVFQWVLPPVILTIVWQVVGDVNNGHFGRNVVGMGAPLCKAKQ